MKHFLKLLMMACMMFVVDPGEGGGADSGSNDGGGSTPPDGGNNGAADGGTDGSQNPSGTNEGAQTPDTVSVPREQFEHIEASVRAMETAAAINAAVSDISTRVPGFDLNKVHDALKEMNKSDPDGAKALNNPKGWEMLWKAEIADADVAADGVNHGRKVSGDSGREELANKINSGDSSISDQAEFFSKHFA